MSKIDMSQPSGFYFVGFVTQKSLETMPTDGMRAKWPINSAMSNTIPFASKSAAKKAARAHHLRDVTILQN